MHQFFRHTILLLLLFSGLLSVAGAQQKGKLFIIGGGERSDELVSELIKTARPAESDYIVILPMASGLPDESARLITEQISALCHNPVRTFNFTKAEANDDQSRIDSVMHARLIYITGGDQNRFMDVVRDSRLYTALHTAYSKGATISGTSAGAAVMSEIMITGEERDKGDKNAFRVIQTNNTVTSQGMGFLRSTIVDQHFIRRSRYNRLISVLADHPDKMVVGIDESTAIIVEGGKARVVGESQVVLITMPKKLRVTADRKPGFRHARLSLLISGDRFRIR